MPQSIADSALQRTLSSPAEVLSADATSEPQGRDPALDMALREAWDAMTMQDYNAFASAFENALVIKASQA